MRHILTMVVMTVAAAGCHGTGKAPRIVQPGAPGRPGSVVTPRQAADLAQVQGSAADARFMQAMLRHHAQALEMTALVPARSGRAEMNLLAQRIEVSQADEMQLMQRWLEVRGYEVPAGHAHDTNGMVMPGMLSADEIGRLAQSSGREFDRLFLELMIKHHDGALTMVKELFSTPGSGQESEIFAFASDVLADQQMEIRRMGAMLEELQP